MLLSAVNEVTNGQPVSACLKTDAILDPVVVGRHLLRVRHGISFLRYGLFPRRWNGLPAAPATVPGTAGVDKSDKTGF